MDFILGDPGADSGGEGKYKRVGKYGMKKSKEWREEPQGTMSYQTSSKRSPLFWLLIGQKNTKVFWHCNQKPGRRRLFGTGLVRLCPQGLYSPFVTFLLCAIFFRPFRSTFPRTHYLPLGLRGWMDLRNFFFWQSNLSKHDKVLNRCGNDIFWSEIPGQNWENWVGPPPPPRIPRSTPLEWLYKR